MSRRVVLGGPSVFGDAPGTLDSGQVEQSLVFPGFRAGSLVGSAVVGCEEALWHRGGIRRSSGGV